MRVLFNLNTPVHLRYFDSTIAELIGRGHEVLLTFTSPHEYAESLDNLAGFDPPPVNLGEAPKRRDDFTQPARQVRAALDYVRYLDPRFARAEFLRTRAGARTVHGALFRPLTARRRLRRWQVNLLMRCLIAAERAIPSSAEIEGFIRSARPDVVLVSPLLNAASYQTDYVKSAMALGIPTGVCVASWDNLTNKGHIKAVPDRVMVWNEAQLREAVELHGVAASKVTVTGAQPFDRWFDREPSTSRQEFCAKVGLPPDRPFVLFCGSRSNIGPGVEPAFVRRWVGALRSGGTGLEDIGVLVRPHPERSGGWEHDPLEDCPGAVVWPRRVLNAIAPDVRTGFFDSLYHCAAVVGVNTSAMIEAAIIGRPVLTVRAPEFVESQAGTLHFDHLRPEHGGFVGETADVDEHAAQLAEAIADPRPWQEANRRFVGRFVRPLGLDRPCTPVLADAIERLGREILPARSSTARGPELVLGLLVRRLVGRRAGAEGWVTRARAKRMSAVLRRLAKRTRRHRRVSVVSRRLAQGVESAGRRSQLARRETKEERREEHSRVIDYGARLLDPEGVGEASRPTPAILAQGPGEE